MEEAGGEAVGEEEAVDADLEEGEIRGWAETTAKCRRTFAQ